MNGYKYSSFYFKSAYKDFIEYLISIHYDEAIIILTSIKYYKKYSKIELLLTSSYMEGMVLYKVQILILPSSLIILLSKM